MLYFYVVMILQIVLESLPVSSSGHVALVTALYEQYFMHHLSIGALSFDAWFHSLHAMTACIVAIFFFNQWFFLLRNALRTWRIIAKLIALTFISDLLTAGWYLFFHAVHCEPSLLFGFSITLCILSSLYFAPQGQSKRAFNLRDAFILGMVQGITLLPGISRFAATFALSRWLGYTNERAFTLSWMIQWPLICAASLVGFYQLHKAHILAFYYSPDMILLFLAAGLVGYFALRFAYWCAIRNKFWRFAYYMLVPLVITIAFGST